MIRRSRRAPASPPRVRDRAGRPPDPDVASFALTWPDPRPRGDRNGSASSTNGRAAFRRSPRSSRPPSSRPSINPLLDEPDRLLQFPRSFSAPECSPAPSHVARPLATSGPAHAGPFEVRLAFHRAEHPLALRSRSCEEPGTFPYERASWPSFSPPGPRAPSRLRQRPPLSFRGARARCSKRVPTPRRR